MNRKFKIKLYLFEIGFCFVTFINVSVLNTNVDLKTFEFLQMYHLSFP